MEKEKGKEPVVMERERDKMEAAWMREREGERERIDIME